MSLLPVVTLYRLVMYMFAYCAVSITHFCVCSTQRGIRERVCVVAKAAPPLDVYPGTSFRSSVIIHTV